MKFPLSDFIDFLYWVKDQTEYYWQHFPVDQPVEYGCPEWLRGAKWIGMMEDEIDSVQERYSITFTPEHREFLRVLHTIDKKAGDSEHTFIFSRNWLEDDADIRYRLAAVNNEIREKVASNFWFNSWGSRPDDFDERMLVFDNQLKNAPKLIPVAGHRYQVADMSLENRPVLSILGVDMVYYGSDFRYYLINEIGQFLNINSEDNVAEEDKDDEWLAHVRDEYKHLFEPYDKTKLPDFPFWKNFVLIDWTNWANNTHL
ncbi:hypothetical protein CJD36_005505 [Flavipsychrobacter stenotrophus]|uniref:Knr4/Smi1-like domain-containing protein n=1 Tax=Flavipsychrobacter stenotrophus TaxID=2077091 RepID=A0A2S7SWF1_9BACT|nr:hypothetical protein [Flavipsychrobacter stenotrophus]PQJ11262.1 hypothetical protein CJD36_005505 [Flavipsychrobacter stenotrophus]